MNKPEVGVRRIIWRLPDDSYVMQPFDARSHGFTRREAVPVPVKPTQVIGHRIVSFDTCKPMYELLLLSGECNGDGFACMDAKELIDTISDLVAIDPNAQFKVTIV